MIETATTEQIEKEIAQDRMAQALRELIAELDKPKKEISKVQIAAKITGLAAMAETAGDVSAVVWNHVGPEMRVGAFGLLLGIIGASLEQQ